MIAHVDCIDIDLAADMTVATNHYMAYLVVSVVHKRSVWALLWSAQMSDQCLPLLEFVVEDVDIHTHQVLFVRALPDEAGAS